MRSFVQKVVVAKDEIVIIGAKSELAELVTGAPVGAFPQNKNEVVSAHVERGWWS